MVNQSESKDTWLCFLLDPLQSVVQAGNYNIKYWKGRTEDTRGPSPRVSLAADITPGTCEINFSYSLGRYKPSVLFVLTGNLYLETWRWHKSCFQNCLNCFRYERLYSYDLLTKVEKTVEKNGHCWTQPTESTTDEESWRKKACQVILPPCNTWQSWRVISWML